MNDKLMYSTNEDRNVSWDYFDSKFVIQSQDGKPLIEMKELNIMTEHKIYAACMDIDTDEVLWTMSVHAKPTGMFKLDDKFTEEQLLRTNPTLKDAYDVFQKAKQQYFDLRKICVGKEI